MDQVPVSQCNSSPKTDLPRSIQAHKVNGLNDALNVLALDGPGPGGASHMYRIEGVQGPLDHHPIAPCNIWFQIGPITESGYNGISNEALLAVVIDRLDCFQRGPYQCRENDMALTKLQEAMHWLHYRTRERAERGVEGTSAK